MGRPSKLSEKQWHDVEAMVLAGKPLRSIAKQFGISESSIRGRLSAQIAETKAVANQIVDTKQRLSALPISAQIRAQQLADEMLAVSAYLASAAQHGAKVSRESMELAAKQFESVNHDDPMESADILQGIAALTRIANESSTIGRDLLKTFKDDGAKDQGKAIVIERSYGA